MPLPGSITVHFWLTEVSNDRLTGPLVWPCKIKTSHPHVFDFCSQSLCEHCSNIYILHKIDLNLHVLDELCVLALRKNNVNSELNSETFLTFNILSYMWCVLKTADLKCGDLQHFKIPKFSSHNMKYLFKHELILKKCFLCFIVAKNRIHSEFLI